MNKNQLIFLIVTIMFLIITGVLLQYEMYGIAIGTLLSSIAIIIFGVETL